MTLVGLLGPIIALLAWQMAFVERTRTRAAIFFLAFLTHIGTTILYYFWVQTTVADTILYYDDPYSFYGTGFGMGTRFVIYMVQYLKDILGGTYLDYFLLFQAFGFWGVVLMMRIFEEIHIELGTKQSPFTYLLFFLPSIHFWTSAIGKDAPLFLAASLAVWSAMQLRRRFIAFGLSILIMVLFRPYIALAALMALALSAFIDPRNSVGTKLVLLLAAFAAVVPVLGTVENTFRVDVTSAESVSDFFQYQSEISAQDEGGSAVVGASYPVRIFSLLFRPLFVDSKGAVGLIASLENLFRMFILFQRLRNFGSVKKLVRSVFFVRFGSIFAVVLILLLGFVYYNVGLGLRQKVMFMPGLLTLFVAVLAVKHAKAARTALSYA